MDKARERGLMATALFDMPYRAVATTERPDIQVLVGSHVTFGVEVTEVFEHGSHARLLNIPGYLQHLTNGGRPRHKDDLRHLSVTPSNADDHESSDPATSGGAVTLNFSGTRGHFDKVANAIEAKSSLCDSYEYVTHGFALVIGDYIPLLFDPRSTIPVRAVLTPRLRKALFASSFFEIYLLPTVEDQYPSTRLRLRAAATYEWACIAAEFIEAALNRYELSLPEQLSVWAALMSPTRPRRLATWLDIARRRIYTGRTYLEIRGDGSFATGQDFTESQGGIVPQWPNSVPSTEREILTAAIELAFETNTIEFVLFDELRPST